MTITAVTSDDAPVVGLLLAAGASRRLGAHGPKQLLPWRGRPLVRHAAETMLAAGLERVVVVVGHRADDVAAALDGLEGTAIVRSSRWRHGQSGSLRDGIDAVEDAAPGRAVLVMPCDQPFLTAAHLRRVLEARAAGAELVATRYGSESSVRLRAPALFTPRHFDALRDLRGDRGARSVIDRHADSLHAVDAEGPHAALDVDTIETYRRLLVTQGTALG